MSTKTPHAETSKVFVLEPPSLDISKAERYGQLVYLFGPRDIRASFWDDTFKRQLEARLEEVGYRPMKDYLLIAGQVAPLAVAIATLVANYGPARLLLYHAVERDYRQKIVGDTTRGEKTSNQDASRSGKALHDCQGGTQESVPFSEHIA